MGHAVERLIFTSPRVCFRRVARLHREGIPAGFLSTLGETFLSRLYQGIAGSGYGAVQITRGSNAEITGFIATALDTRLVYRDVLARCATGLTLCALPRLVHPRVVAKSFETLRYGLCHKGSEPSGKGAPPPRAELLAVAVDSKELRKGVARVLVGAHEALLRENGIMRYRVVTTAGDDTPAAALYRACGLTVARRIRHHGRLLDEYLGCLTP